MNHQLSVVLLIVIAVSCASEQEIPAGATSIKERGVSADRAEDIRTLIKRISSWSVWRGPCEGFSLRDLKLLSGKEKAYRKLQELFDALYLAGKESPEEVFRQLCLAPGRGVEHTYAGHWFLSCDPQKYAPVVGRMIAESDTWLRREDFGAQSSVGLGLKTPGEALREFLLYMLQGSAGVLRSCDELKVVLHGLVGEKSEHWLRVLAECNDMAALDVLIHQLDERFIATSVALQYSSFAFHRYEWDTAAQWRDWWQLRRSSSFDDVVSENIAEFLQAGCVARPGQEHYKWPRWVMLTSLFPLGSRVIETDEGMKRAFPRLEPPEQSGEVICRRMNDVWNLIKNKSFQERVLLGLENAFRVLRSEEASATERGIAVYVVKEFVEAEALKGLGVMPLYGGTKPFPSAEKLARVLAWWQSKPKLSWDGQRRRYVGR